MTKPYTDPEWRPDTGGLPERPFAIATPTAGTWFDASPKADTGTITPPEPSPEPEPASLSSRESRIADAEFDLMSALRALLNATDWLHRAQANLRKARAP